MKRKLKVSIQKVNDIRVELGYDPYEIENAESARQIIAGDIDNYIEHFCK